MVLPSGGSIWTSAVIGALGALGFEERNARQAIARLAESDVVEPERIGRRTLWHLTQSGRDLLGSGAARIYAFGSAPAAWDGRWLVVVASVPEEQRAKRHQLRTRLAFLGFGFLGPSLAISPHLDREREVTGELERLGLLPGALVLRAEPGDAVASPDLVRRAWDLDELATRYHEFLDEFGPRSPRSPAGRFVALVELVHVWRRFPFVDPEFPRELLPSRWAGGRAKTLFDAKHAAWSRDATAWYSALAAADSTPPSTT